MDIPKFEKIEDWFKFLTGLEPTGDQVNVLKSVTNLEDKKIVVSAGRQSGKTLTVAVAILYWVFCYNEPIKILLISPQTNVLYYHIRNIFDRNKDLFEGHVLAEGVYSLVPLRGFTTDRGTQVWVKGATDKQIRGIPADMVVIDEACEVKNDIILTALGNLSGKISKIILLSTPHKSNSLFVKWATEPESQFKVFQWSSEGLAWHDKTLLETKRKEMSREQYAVEVLGRPPTKEERAFFPKKHIDKCIFEGESVREGGQIEIGVDFGETESKTVLTVVEKIGKIRRKVLYVKSWKLPPELVAPEIMTEILKWKPSIVKADNRPKEYREALKKLTDKIVFLDGIFHKDLMLGQLQAHVREHNVLIPQNQVELIKQLTTYKRGKSTGDDYVDSLALACYEFEVPRTSFSKVAISSIE
ncbi:MAG: terminase large subunit domain-containing protein [Caldisericum exile]|uniref:terminase large subunit domain-containing protein n=1 Tax=Caldisericum exile TaxID=693075 RepID=UPI003C7466D0